VKSSDIATVRCARGVPDRMRFRGRQRGFTVAADHGLEGLNLLRMAQLSLPVPPAFVLGTHYCVDPAARQLAASPGLWSAALHALERATDKASATAVDRCSSPCGPEPRYRCRE